MSAVSHRKGDETQQTLQQGRPAVAYTGRHHRYRSAGLVALAVRGFSTLPSARYLAVAVVGGVRSARAVPAFVAMVAAVRVAVSAHHRYASQPRCASTS
jgi:hypothetical protein